MKSRFWLVAASCLLWVGVALSQVNINTASREELDSLKGIGPARANAIIKFREENGPFKSVNELKNVPNFPDSLVGKLRNKITVGGETRVTAPQPPVRPTEKPLVPADQSLARPAGPAMPTRPALPSRPSVEAPAAIKPAAPAAPARPAMYAQPAVPATHELPERAPAAPAAPLGKPAAPPAPARPAMAN